MKIRGSRRLHTLVAAGALAAGSLAVVAAVQAPTQAAGDCFTAGTLSDTVYTVPASGVSSVHIQLYGQPGGWEYPDGNLTAGGRGSSLAFVVAATPGQKFRTGTLKGGTGGASHEPPGGVSMRDPGDNGGDAQFAVLDGACPTLLGVAAGGGGAADHPYFGGPGGDADYGQGAQGGSDGGDNSAIYGGGGHGGGATSGGAGGTPGHSASVCYDGNGGGDGGFASAGNGGEGTETVRSSEEKADHSTSYACIGGSGGGGGGAGYYGGGGGGSGYEKNGSGGGGGGSSYVSPSAKQVRQDAYGVGGPPTSGPFNDGQSGNPVPGASLMGVSATISLTSSAASPVPDPTTVSLTTKVRLNFDAYPSGIITLVDCRDGVGVPPCTNLAQGALEPGSDFNGEYVLKKNSRSFPSYPTHHIVATYQDSAGLVPTLTSSQLQMTFSPPASSATATPGDLDFGNHLVNSGGTQTVTVTNTGVAALKPSTINFNDDNGAYSVSGGTCKVGVNITVGGSCTVDVTFVATKEAELDGNLLISDSSTPTAKLVTYVNLTGRGYNQTVFTDVDTLPFGSQALNTSSSTKSVLFRMQGIGGTPALNVSSIAITGPNADQFTRTGGTCVAPGTLATNTDCTVVLSFKPTSGGTKSATLTFNDDGPRAPHTVTLTGSGSTDLAQNVAFTSSAPTSAVYGGSYTPTTSGGASGNPVVVTSSSTTICTVSGGLVSLVRAGTCTLKADQAAATGYSAGSATQSFTVAKAPLGITASDGSTTYRSGAATITPSYSGFVNGDGADDLTAKPTCSSSAPDVVGSYAGAATCAGAASPNYAFTYTAGRVTVAKRALTITASDATSSYGFAAPAVVAGYSGLGNGDTAANSLSTLPTCSSNTSETTHAGIYVGMSTCSGASSANYAITYVPGKVTIDKVVLGVTGPTLSRTYGAANPTLVPSLSGYKNGDTADDLTTPPTCTTTAQTGSPAGSYAVTCSGGNAVDYLFGPYTAGSLTVTQAPLTVTAGDAQPTYGDNPGPVINPSYGGFVNGDDADDLTTKPSCASNITPTTAAGVYLGITTCAGATSPNYEISYATGNITVTKAPVTVTASGGSQVYGATTAPVVTKTIAGLRNNQPASVLGSITCSANVDKSTPAGTYASTCSSGSSPNYVVSYVPGVVTVAKAPAVVTAGSTTSVWGTTPPVPTATVSGLKNGQTKSVLTVQPTCSAGVTSTTNVGSYPSTTSCSGAVAANYTFTYVKGTATVTKANLVITAPSISIKKSAYAGKMTFTATVRNATGGAPIAGVRLDFATTSVLLYTLTCTATTNAQGVGTCTNANGNLLLIRTPGKYTVKATGTSNYNAATATGPISYH